MTTVTITLLVDNNEPTDPECKCSPAPGLAMLLDRGNFAVLLDTGPDRHTIISNAERLDIDRSKIDTLVISHRHRDHTGGIESVFEMNPNLKVFLPEPIEVPFMDVEVVDNDVMIRRLNGDSLRIIRTVGEYKGEPIPENTLVLVDHDRDAYIFCGCCHTGIDKVVTRVAELGFEPLMVAGGLHLVGKPRSEIERIADVLIDHGVELAMPVHCSGDLARMIFSEKDMLVIEAGVCSQVPLEYR